MPPQAFSRFEFTTAIRDRFGRLFLTEREPIRFISLPDSRLHVVKQGDTLFSIADRFFRPKPRPAGFWWVIADFQPDPIIDPTLALEVGRQIVVPSLRTLDELILDPSRGRFL